MNKHLSEVNSKNIVDIIKFKPNNEEEITKNLIAIQILKIDYPFCQ